MTLTLVDVLALGIMNSFISWFGGKWILEEMKKR